MAVRQQCSVRPTSIGARGFLGNEDTTIGELVPALRASADERQRLLRLIAAQQKACRSYLAKVKPQFTALTYVNLVAGALAAAVAAGPALGGSGLLDQVQVQLNVGSEDLIYQGLCAIAFVMSLASVITANIIRARDFSSRIAVVEGCYAELDSLRIQLMFARVSSNRGAEIVAKAAARVPFVAGETLVRHESLTRIQ